MCDLQPGVTDILIAEADRGYSVSVFGNVGPACLCATLPGALTTAEVRARRGGVGVWFAEADGTIWRVRQYSAVDEPLPA